MNCDIGKIHCLYFISLAEHFRYIQILLPTTGVECMIQIRTETASRKFKILPLFALKFSDAHTNILYDCVLVLTEN